jgi:Cohesin domain
MKRIFNFLGRAAWVTLLVLASTASGRAGVRTLSLPSYLANPGAVLEVPLSLDNAAGLAGVRVQINFNTEILELLTVTAEPLGAAFDMSHGDGDGVVQLVFARAEMLVSGAGRLALLRFRVNPGAVAGLYSELAIADFSFSDSTGVIDLRQKDTLSATSGVVSVTLSQNIDNANNGLPDWWEQQHGLSLFDNANLDIEPDGLSNFLEYAFGANPSISDVRERGIQTGVVTVGQQTFLSLGFYRRVGNASLLYRVQESASLSLWNDLNLSLQMTAPPMNMGDGTEFVGVRGTIPLSGVGAGPRGFLRVVVEKP